MARKLKAWELGKGAPSLWEEGLGLERGRQRSEVLSIFIKKQLNFYSCIIDVLWKFRFSTHLLYTVSDLVLK